MNLDPIRVKYAAERATYEAAARTVAERVRSACRDRGIVGRVDHRAKEMHSLLLKALWKGKSYEDIGDKAGVRLILAYPDDRSEAARMIRDMLRPVKEEDFRAPSDPARFDYSGLHFDVVVESGGANLACEVQLHTPGESLWASLAHDLVYKGTDSPYEVRRASHRLRALTEMFDLEAARMREVLMAQETAEEQQILRALTRHYLPLGLDAGRGDLSLRLIRSLKDGLAAEERKNLEPALSSFVAASDEKLRHIFAHRLADDSHPLLHQPESLLMFLLLDRDPTSLADVWPPWLPAMPVRDFATLWGVPAHDPDSMD